MPPQSYQISKDERNWMAKFFRDFFLEEGAVYTLWGTKPMTCVVLYHYTEEERQAYYTTLSKEEVKNAHFIDHYDLPDQWLKWEEIASRFPLNRYLLFREINTTDSKESYVYFVDILKTAAVIQQNYEAFCRNAGFDFNPLEVVFELPDSQSPFWRATKSNCALLGLLLGFGPKNAWSYYWRYHLQAKNCATFFKTIHSPISDTSLKGKQNVSLGNFELPAFISFDDPDEMIEEYKKQRAHIQKIYQGRDFVDLTLQRLTRK